MNCYEAFQRLDALGEQMARSAAMTLPANEWRLLVRARRGPDASQVELQHWEGSDKIGYWYSVANVNTSLGSQGVSGELSIKVYITCTMCGRWSDERGRAKGLQELFKVADAFEEFTSGKVFEAT